MARSSSESFIYYLKHKIQHGNKRVFAKIKTKTSFGRIFKKKEVGSNGKA